MNCVIVYFYTKVYFKKCFYQLLNKFLLPCRLLQTMGQEKSVPVRCNSAHICHSSASSTSLASSKSLTPSRSPSTASTTSSGASYKSIEQQKKYLNEHLYIKSYLDSDKTEKVRNLILTKFYSELTFLLLGQNAAVPAHPSRYTQLQAQNTQGQIQPARAAGCVDLIDRNPLFCTDFVCFAQEKNKKTKKQQKNLKNLQIRKRKTDKNNILIIRTSSQKWHLHFFHLSSP